MLPVQASTKVYQAKEDGHAAVQRLEASVGAGGLLVFSPDPLVPFAQSYHGWSWLPGAGVMGDPAQAINRQLNQEVVMYNQI